jgi:hypothetical protein
VYQPDGDCSLVAKIAPQTQSSYGSHHGEPSLEGVMIATLHRAIINQENLDSAGVGRNSFVKTPDQFRSRKPIVSERHQH